MCFVELIVSGGGVFVSVMGIYCCDDVDKLLKVVFYNDIDLVVVIVILGIDQVIVFLIESVSGSCYGCEGVVFWEYQGEVMLDFYGIVLCCMVDC